MHCWLLVGLLAPAWGGGLGIGVRCAAYLRHEGIEGFGAADHEAADDVAEGDVHFLADEDDTVEMVGHQLVLDELDVALAGLAGLGGFFRSQLTLELGDLIPAAKHFETEGRGLDERTPIVILL